MFNILKIYNKIVVVFSVLYLLLAFYYLSHPQVVLTHYHNSEITYLKARDMQRGDHQWGLFFDGPDHRTPRYEFHMPEGPTYVMAAWMKLGLPVKAYKIVPVCTSLLAHIVFLLALLYHFGPKVSPEKIALLFSWIAFQPMIVAWSSAVDDGSFNISLMVLLASAALFQWKGRWWGYLLLGFLLGCQEFYRQPMMLLFLWFVEFIMASQQQPKTPKALWGSFLWASLAGVGVVLGLLAHIGQLALVWGSWSDAWNEMAGAALGRASIQNELNPAFFQEKLTDQITAGAPTEWVRLKTICKIFFGVFWYDRGRQHLWPVVFVAGLIWFYYENAMKPQTLKSPTQDSFKLFALNSLFSTWAWTVGAFLFLIPNIWTLMMPNHASVHYYYIARDYSGWCWAVGILLLAQKSFK